MTPPAITGLLAALVKTAVLEPARALELLEKSRSTKEPLLQTLMANGVSAIKIARAASQNYGLPQIDLDSFDTSDLPINIVPAKLLQSGNALPLRKRGRRLTVAMADPSDLGILENFRFSTNLTIDVVVA
ncbi:MAG: type IV-A pilus assembly ATPase PilB, partial [Halothiobacillus sp. 20-53-49]